MRLFGLAIVVFTIVISQSSFAIDLPDYREIEVRFGCSAVLGLFEGRRIFYFSGWLYDLRPKVVGPNCSQKRMEFLAAAERFLYDLKKVLQFNELFEMAGRYQVAVHYSSLAHSNNPPQSEFWSDLLHNYKLVLSKTEGEPGQNLLAHAFRASVYASIRAAAKRRAEETHEDRMRFDDISVAGVGQDLILLAHVNTSKRGKPDLELIRMSATQSVPPGPGLLRALVNRLTNEDQMQKLFIEALRKTADGRNVLTGEPRASIERNP